MIHKLTVMLALLLSAGASQFASAQIEREPVPSITEPIIIDTFEAGKVRVVPVVTGLANPYAMVFRDNGDILIGERYSGRLRIVRGNRLLEDSVEGMPAVYGAQFRAGLMGLALHPQDDALVYMAYTKPVPPVDEVDRTIALARGRLVEDRLVEVTELFQASTPDQAIGAAALLFTPDNKLLMSVGGAVVYAAVGEVAQASDSHYGKLLRFNDDGSVPADNPFVANGQFLPEVYSVGHRNQLGLTFHPETGELWASENGPQGGDEINIVFPGSNYGWPLVSFSRQYRGDWVTGRPDHTNFESPVVLWWPSIAPSAITFYTGDRFPAWQGNLFVGSMMVGRIPGTGHLERLVFNSRGEEIRRESLLRELQQRVIDVKQGPDGFLYLLTDEEDGALLRLEPAQ